MPGGDVIARSSPSLGQSCGIVGKLPPHGDFVRRGGPAALLMQLDRWLDAALGDAVTGGIALDVVIAALDGWRFAFPGPGGMALATVIASEDAVGRRFPLVAVAAGVEATSPIAAERWCAAAGDVLAAVRDASGGADTALAAIDALGPPTMDGGSTMAGWWRAGDAAPTGAARLPVGDAFRMLVRREGK